MIVGFGRLGIACAEAAREVDDVCVVGVVRRAERVREKLSRPFEQLATASHVGELPPPDAALVCVPTDAALGVALELLQRRVPIVECASLRDDAFERHREEIDRVARHHRVAACVGAGWSPGVLDRLASTFALLIPRGSTAIEPRPGASLHHTAAAASAKGVKDALAAETRTADGVRRYVYVELERGARFADVERALRADPLFAGEDTQVFEVDSIAALEESGHGVLLERRGGSGAGAHDTLLLEARFDPARFTARLMIDGARRLAGQAPGARVYLPADTRHD